MKEFFTNLFHTVVGTVTSNWNRILTFLIILIVGYIVVKVVGRIFSRAMDRSKLKGATGNFLKSLVKVALLALYVIISTKFCKKEYFLQSRNLRNIYIYFGYFFSGID